MRSANTETGYRPEIDGLRTLAVLSVYFFHCGLLPNGYLGVDIFFAISGFLITGILFRESQAGRFSLLHFYNRRVRRILPLCLTVSAIALAIGYFVMLPDDLENLSQSVIATNLFSNNVLQAITTKNYWDIKNDFKPLLHTWSLGVEEQYYAIVPLVFMMFRNRVDRFALPFLLLATITSFSLNFFGAFEEHEKFYYLPFRFWEISAGGLMALWCTEQRPPKQWTGLLSVLSLTIIGLVIVLPKDALPSPLLRLVVVACSVVLLAPSDRQSKWVLKLLTNPLAVFLGKISYSLYMWHQLFLAFSRYLITPEIDFFYALKLLAILIPLSYLSYCLIEQPFRNKRVVGFKAMSCSLIAMYVVLFAASLKIYRAAGVVRDVPELEIARDTAVRGQHSKYNSRIFEFDRPFANDSRVKVLVVGNSFARDWCNVLIESKIQDRIDLTYIPAAIRDQDVDTRITQADVVFWSTPLVEDVRLSGIDERKLWVVGTKNFGVNSGFFYNRQGPEYCKQFTPLEAGVLEANFQAKHYWKDRYIDLLEPILDTNDRVPVFTPDCKFISQDTRHLTAAGARFYAQFMNERIRGVLFGTNAD